MDKHFFIINPVAGKGRAVDLLRSRIEALSSSYNCTFAITQSPGHARSLVKEALASLPAGDRLRVYACGGDGTLFETVNGGVCHPAFAVGNIPVGSGNDFIKTFPDYTKDDFLDLERMVTGPIHCIDSLRVGELTSLNIVSAGFDARVCQRVVKFKGWPLVNGSMAYKLALLSAVFTCRRNFFGLTADGEQLEDGTHPHLFAIAANGRYYGGGFKASPTSDPADGLLDVITIPTLSVWQFIRFTGIFRRGEHVGNPDLPFVRHSVRHSLQITSRDEVLLNVDGEMISLRDPEITLCPRSVNFILPAAR